ncbi:hypothetical protein R5R35_013293 [Gryllus longicercus]|uniref:DNA-directed RNA polymerase III subunit RPC8 n=1 Tax=Gryllus longicercus TaxID=2509291 RepID=A0AAN9VC99_9ORTH|nr:DNA-directed RNA polymerase III subunit RPC8 [Gryllus bimaculatus]
MFVLAEMTKTLRVPPHRFGINLNEAIAEDLTKTLVGKVIKEVGLCIALFDITCIKESFILPGDGAAHTKVNFRLVVFKPFSEEVILGKIKNCSEEGVRVTLGFFDNIIISPESLQQPCRYDEDEKVWIWEYESKDGKHDLFMDPGEPIRFRVTGNKFVETIPCDSKPEEQESSETTEKEKIAPYTITASISEPGLGLVSWWT